MDVLELIKLGKDFNISKSDDGAYEIEHTRFDVGASIDSNGGIKLYVTNAYNSGSQWLEIDFEGLEELKVFCNLIISQEGTKC